MVQEISIGEAGKRLEELSEQVHDTREPVVLEKQGEPFVAVVSLETLREYEQLRSDAAVREFRRLTKEAAARDLSPPTEEEILQAVKRTREELYRERYGSGS